VFTQSTAGFGIWKSDHPSHRRHTGSPTVAVMVALGVCAFICWLVFFLTLRLRGEFFVLENEGLRLAQVSASDPALHEGRTVALRMGVRHRPGGGLALLLETGEVIRYPGEAQRLKEIVGARAFEMERTGLLTLVANPAISRAELWPEADVPPAAFDALLRDLVELGYDDFDVAMEVR
jgi:hypothetical protein